MRQKVLIGKDELSGMVFGHYISCKGTGDECLLRQIVWDLHEFGRSDRILKTDGGPAIVGCPSLASRMLVMAAATVMWVLRLSQTNARPFTVTAGAD